ncbi:MAG TPA: response regulator transcription factor [Candidatus Limnocylindrales bacterium]|nr:response regulator transcription factor [Candidatus Limnocylindrales bacterium]
MIRVVIADDQPLIRTGLRTVLEVEDDITVVGEAADGAQAVDLCTRERPDVVLMDVRMPRMDGLRAARRLRELSSPTRVVMLTTFDLDEYVYEALRAGASGFLLKDATAGQLVAAVRAAAEGNAMLAPSVTRRLIAEFSQRAATRRPAQDLSALTEREREVLTLIGEGLSNSEIARRLSVSETTVKTHVGHVLGKLELRDRVQAVILAHDAGLVS